MSAVDFVNTESRHLRRHLRRIDSVFFAIAAIVSLDTIGQIATHGAESFFWTLVLAIAFLLPYGLLIAELGSTFTQEGGPYVWMRLAFGRLAAAIGTVFYWVTNPVWLGGSLALLAAATWDAYLSPIISGDLGDYLFKMAFIWIAILGAIVSLRYGKWLSTAGAIVKIGLIALFAGTVVLYATQHGVRGDLAGLVHPTVGGLLGVVAVLMFSLVGFDAPNGAAEEMHDPRRDVPVMVAASGVVTALCYLVPVVGVLVVLPPRTITGLDGFMHAVAEVFAVYGPAQRPLLTVAAIAFIYVLFSQGCTWMIASDRVQAIAAVDGTFPRWFGAFHPTLGTPVRVNLLSGAIATLFTIAATQLQHGAAASVFGIVLNIAVSTLLMSYLLIVPSAYRLRRLNAPRAFKVPGGRTGLLLCTGLAYGWVLLGVWQTILPGTLEPVFGVSYDFVERWGVTRGGFELFTFATLAVIVVLGLAGYVLARSGVENRAEHT
ncbi:APC family permease [Pseudonocardia eucalypti]|uniref:APC family permease n=1 Tax=Pseudonocardia eucalypti TaxID=648755 RepID=A0ABP9QQX2_9PSEU|nr:amino acid transporter [Pseudonocardia eucalypti]